MFKKLLSAVLSAATAVSFIPQIPARAEEAVRYPYVIFAGSAEEGAITINSNNVCINGSIATNGTISTTAQNFNVNGSRTENAQETMKFFFDKIDSRYFTSHVDTYFEDYFLEDTNINVNIPIEAEGDIGLTGNINITSGIKALNDVVLSGNVENSQDSVICAETGDIIIDTDNVNLNGLVYAPNGCVNITAQNLNINSVIIIADTITITCPNLNANYNSQMAEFIGNESEPINNDDIEIVAYGEYDDETEALSVYWNTTVPDGSFDIQASDDGESYTSIGNVNGTDSFEFSFNESFEKKYIKVIETANSGKVGESVPFVVICTEDGYDIEVLDSDEDGLPDIYELKIGTDPYDQDTDDDGLTDYQEYVYTQTDPLVYDSVTEGVSDADIDTDEDGLSNIDEFTRETYPWTPDTDQDGLSDYDEIFVYNTDPLIADSDEDGVDDGSEVKLGLDPNDPATNGVPDGEYIIPQAIDADSSILSSVNTAESPYELSIDIKTNGDAEKELTVDESGYSAAIENDAMIGASFDVEITDTCNPEEIVLKYDIKEGYTENTLNKFSSLEEFQGIKRLNVFRFDEEQGMLFPIETKFDIENDQLYAAVNETGTYCLMDMEIWLDNLDVEIPDENISSSVPSPKAAPKALTAATTKWEPEYVNAPIDLVFILQTAGYNEYGFNQEKSLISMLSMYVFNNYKNVNAYIITYDKSASDTRYSDINGRKLNNFYKVDQALDHIKYNDGVTDYCDRSAAFRCLANHTPIRANSDVYIYQFVNGSTDGKSSYDNLDIIQEVKAGKYKAYSEIFTNGWHYEYSDRQANVKNGINNNNDLFIELRDATLPVLKDHFDSKLSAPRPVYDIIVPTKWKKISLTGELIPNGTTNSDTDSLTDWEEVDTSKIKVDPDGSIELPVFNLEDILYYSNRYNDKVYQFLLNNLYPKYYLPILSDPTDEDTDDDGLNDDVDEFPKQNFTINLNNCIEKIQNIEKYLKDYLSEIGQDRNDYMDYCMFLIRTHASKYTGFKWFLTAGHTYADDKFVKYLNAKDKTCLEFFQKMDAHPVYDAYGNEIDFLHLIATLSGQYNKSSHFFIDEDLSGWLGDLQSFIYDLKLATYGTNKDLKDTALKLIATGDTKFDSTDMFADIDAKNISCIYNTSDLLSHTLEDYYLKYTSKRFNLFIENSGEIDDIKKKAQKYTSQSLNPSHQLLTSFADAVTEEHNLFDIYFSNYVIDEHGNEIYTLNLPNIVSKEESEALVYAFVTYIQNGKEKEDER